MQTCFLKSWKENFLPDCTHKDISIRHWHWCNCYCAKTVSHNPSLTALSCCSASGNNEVFPNVGGLPWVGVCVRERELHQLSCFAKKEGKKKERVTVRDYICLPDVALHSFLKRGEKKVLKWKENWCETVFYCWGLHTVSTTVCHLNNPGVGVCAFLTLWSCSEIIHWCCWILMYMKDHLSKYSIIWSQWDRSEICMKERKVFREIRCTGKGL